MVASERRTSELLTPRYISTRTLLAALAFTDSGLVLAAAARRGRLLRLVTEPVLSRELQG